MRPSESTSHDWMDARVEAYLDDALPADEQAAFEKALTGDDRWEAELFLARRVQAGLHALPQPPCPPRVADAVLAETRRRTHTAWSHRLHGWLERQWMELWQPALAMAVLILLVVSAALLGGPPQPASRADAEVDRARAEVQWTLAYLSEVGRQTGQAVRRDVIEARVVSPMQDALGARHQHPNDPQR